MSGHATPPGVDERGSQDWLAAVRRALRPTPGRFGNSLQLLALVLVAVTIGEVFRLPSLAILAFFVFFLFSQDEGTTLLAAALAGGALLPGSLAIIVVFMATLSEPAMRIPLLAVLTFLAGFLLRASSVGIVFYAFGFWVTYGATEGDALLGIALQPSTITNTTGSSVPDLAYFPPEEALLHLMLWLMLVVGVAVLLVLVVNALMGRDPLLLLRQGLADRLEAAAAFCEGAPEASERLAGLAKEGIAQLAKLDSLGRRLHWNDPDPAVGERLIHEVARLVLALLAWERMGSGPTNVLHGFAQDCRTAARAVRAGKAVPDDALGDLTLPDQEGVSDAAVPLLEELSRRTKAIKRTLSAGAAQDRCDMPATVKTPRAFFVSDAFSNPEYVQFALKLTLAAMTCYAIERLANWPNIHTCLVTCFVVSLETTGQSTQKMVTRLTGGVIGGAFGIGVILLLMPSMTNLGDLLLVLTPVTLFSAWIKNGSPRVSYVGVQMALAYFLVLLQGFGPTLDMQTGRDRVIGILLGDVVVYLVFTTLWPVNVAHKVRGGVADALEGLADLLVLHQADPAGDLGQREEELRQRFTQAIAKTRDFMVNDRYEPERVRPDRIRSDRAQRPIDSTTVMQVQALIIPVSIILRIRLDPAWHDAALQARGEAAQAYERDMSDWLRRSAAWVRTGESAADLIVSLPEAPNLEGGADQRENAVNYHLAGRAAWCDVLRRDIYTFLNEIGPDAKPAAVPPIRDAVLA